MVWPLSGDNSDGSRDVHARKSYKLDGLGAHTGVSCGR